MTTLHANIVQDQLHRGGGDGGIDITDIKIEPESFAMMKCLPVNELPRCFTDLSRGVMVRILAVRTLFHFICSCY